MLKANNVLVNNVSSGFLCLIIRCLHILSGGSEIKRARGGWLEDWHRLDRLPFFRSFFGKKGQKRGLKGRPTSTRADEKPRTHVKYIKETLKKQVSYHSKA